MRHALALFDLDGTLADSLPWFHAATQRLAAEFNFKVVPAADFDRYRDREASSLLAELKLPVWKVPRVVAAARRLMASEIDRITLFPGIDAFARRAHEAGVKLGVVSSNSEANARSLLKTNLDRFTVFECGVSLLGKASKLKRAAQRARVPLNQCLYVGDELRDLVAARKAGMAFGGVTWGWARRSGFIPHHPDAIFDSVQELADYLCPPAS